MVANKKIISIITPSYNQGEFIEETIKSVLSQEGDFILDYIIMDGGSTDKTIEIIRKYEKLLKGNCEQENIDNKIFFISKNLDFRWNKCNGVSFRWISQEDEGQADAINKGIKKSYGKVIGWLNSDDVYYPNVFSKVMKKSFLGYDFIYGEGMWVSRIGKKILKYPTFKPSFYSFHYQCTLCQPTVFFTKRVVDEIGYLSNEYYCGFDFEYWMRALYFNKKFRHTNYFFSQSRMYAENKSLANQGVVTDDLNIFKNKYYKNIKLNQKKLEKFKYVHEKTEKDVQILNEKLKFGDQISILFDATVILNDLVNNGGRSGIFFVAFNILKTMINKSDVNIILLCDALKVDDLKNIISEKITKKDIKIITTTDLDNSNLKNIDIYLSPIFKIPEEIKNRKDIIKYTILYDTILLMFPEFFPVRQDWLLEMINEINKDDYYFAISHSTKQDFIKHVPNISPKHITITHLAASDNFYCDITAENKNNVFEKYKLPIDKKYIFSLCTLEPRKNLVATIKNFITFIDEKNIDDLIFVLGGSQWDEFIEKIDKVVENFNDYKDKIMRAGYIDDEDLAVLYSNSEFFVYASLYEGFGLPVLEAMKCGVPVITSNNSSLPEVIGDAGIQINPKSSKEMISAFEKLYFNDNLKKELSKKGLERAKKFSWDKTVDEMTKNIKMVLRINSLKVKNNNKWIKKMKNFVNKIKIN